MRRGKRERERAEESKEKQKILFTFGVHSDVFICVRLNNSSFFKCAKIESVSHSDFMLDGVVVCAGSQD